MDDRETVYAAVHAGERLAGKCRELVVAQMADNDMPNDEAEMIGAAITFAEGLLRLAASATTALITIADAQATKAYNDSVRAQEGR